MNTNKPLILVTGGAGYIGSHTIIELLKAGFDVVSADNYSNSTPKTYERIKNISGILPKYYEGDLCDQNFVRKIFAQNKIDGIIHFAALKSVPESVEKPLLYYNNNFGSLLRMLEAVSEFNVPYFIFSSSCSVYGNVKQLPVNEETPVGDIECPYAYTKLAGERIVQDFSLVNKHSKTVSLRYFNPVGAHESGLIGELPKNRPSNLVPAITQTAIGKIKEMTVFGNDWDTRDGSCIRDYIHVSDIADAHVKALNYLINTKTAANYSLFNLGSGKGVTVFEAIKSFEKISGKTPNYKIGQRRGGDVEAIYSDCSKAENTLGWKPKYSIDEMMSTAWKWELHLNEEK